MALSFTQVPPPTMLCRSALTLGPTLLDPFGCLLSFPMKLPCLSFRDSLCLEQRYLLPLLRLCHALEMPVPPQSLSGQRSHSVFAIWEGPYLISQGGAQQAGGGQGEGLWLFLFVGHSPLVSHIFCFYQAVEKPSCLTCSGL